MTASFPRRDKPAAKVGPRLGLAPDAIRELLAETHGLSNLLMNNTMWESFCWKGTDLSAPLRALWSAETQGLYPSMGQRSRHIAIADIAAEINTHLIELGKSPVTENSVMTNLKTASQYLSVALGVSIAINRQAGTVSFVDGIDNADNIKKYLEQLKAKHTKVAREIDHAVACGYDIAPILAAAEESTGLKVLSSAYSGE